MFQPVLIIGTQRSGSNLLRIMLNQLEEISAPHPPHILQVFIPLLTKYGKLEIDSNFKTLITDVCRFIEANPVKWNNIVLDPDIIFTRCASRSLIQIFRVCYELKAEIKGARFWCCKSMANLYFIPMIEKEKVRPYYIYLIRDGRDVAASFKRTIIGEKHIYFIALQWHQDQIQALLMLKKYGKRRSARLYYEQFIENPRKHLEPILHSLGLEWKTSINRYYESEEARLTAAAGDMWKNVAKPVNHENSMHFSETFSNEEIQIFERVAGKTLVELGYQTQFPLNNKPFEEEEIKYFREINVALKKQAREMLLTDAILRMPQEIIVNEIKKRPDA